MNCERASKRKARFLFGSERAILFAQLEGTGKAIASWNLGTGAAFHLSDVMTMNVFGNMFAIDPLEYRDENKIRPGESAHANLIWSPLKRVNAGLEFTILRRVNGVDNSGFGQRLQFMIKYIL